jgi:cytochrome c oxidase assembly protein subunit 15
MSTHVKNTALSNWLFVTAAAVFVMIVIGAITRLTESGLSMVEWRPLIGSLPPLNTPEWERVFSLYQDTPEFQKKNSWMSIDDFKTIFFWEWFHRFWGRMIGLIYGVPFVVFWLRGAIPSHLKWPLIGLLGLGAAQAYMGWFMVQSGLVDNPSVSHYRLAAHLSLAFTILCCLVWTGMSARGAVPKLPDRGLWIHGWAVLAPVVLTIFWGAYVAGLDAGLIYNSWPLMNGSFLAPEILQLSPAWLNFLEQPGGVQFVHRWIAAVSVIAVLSFIAHAMKKGAMKKSGGHKAVPALVIMVFAQFALGVATLLSGVALPLGVLHQAGAAILLVVLIVNLYAVKPPRC